MEPLSEHVETKTDADVEHGPNFALDSLRELTQLSRSTGVPVAEIIRRNAETAPPPLDYLSIQ